MKFASAVSSLVLATVLAAPAHAADERWISFGPSFSLKKHSGFPTTLADGDLVYSAVIREKRNDGKISVRHIGVTAQACVEESGTIGLYDMSSGKLESEYPFAFGAGNVASHLAETLCEALRATAEEVAQTQPKSAKTRQQYAL